MNKCKVLEDPQLDFDSPLLACPLCGSRKIVRFLTDFKGIAIFKCGSCSLQFMNPQYTDAALTQYYSQYIGHDPLQIRKGYESIRAEVKRRNLMLLKPLVRPSGKSLLETLSSIG